MREINRKITKLDDKFYLITRKDTFYGGISNIEFENITKEGKSVVLGIDRYFDEIGVYYKAGNQYNHRLLTENKTLFDIIIKHIHWNKKELVNDYLLLRHIIHEKFNLEKTVESLI